LVDQAGLHLDQVVLIDRKACLQQDSNQEAMIGFDNAGHLGFVLWTANGGQHLLPFDEPFNGVSDLVSANPTTGLVENQDVVVG